MFSIYLYIHIYVNICKRKIRDHAIWDTVFIYILGFNFFVQHTFPGVITVKKETARFNEEDEDDEENDENPGCDIHYGMSR